jgi:hypothetical protein
MNVSLLDGLWTHFSSVEGFFCQLYLPHRSREDLRGEQVGDRCRERRAGVKPFVPQTSDAIHG